MPTIYTTLTYIVHHITGHSGSNDGCCHVAPDGKGSSSLTWARYIGIWAKQRCTVHWHVMVLHLDRNTFKRMASKVPVICSPNLHLVSQSLLNGIIMNLTIHFIHATSLILSYMYPVHCVYTTYNTMYYISRY